MDSSTIHPPSMAADSYKMGVFFSPPEIRSDSFTSPHQSYKRPSPMLSTTETRQSLPLSALPPPSPPVSPHTVTNKESHLESRDSFHGGHDPQLFQDRPAVAHTESLPALFPSPRKSTQDTIDGRIARQSSSKSTADLSSQENHELGRSICSVAIKRMAANPVKWLQQELEYLKAYPPRFPQQAQAAGVKRKAGESTTPAKRPKVVKNSSTPQKLPRTKRLPRTSPREVVLDSFEPVIVPPTPEPRVIRATPHGEETPFAALPDYCPPLSTLSNAKSLKTEWRGAPLDLSNDPDRHLLHEAEVNLASTLRLKCAIYLSSKRRIFAGRLDALRNGREFRKTTAQQCCSIDVNKASKLHTAFEKAGWFDPKYMARFL